MYPIQPETIMLIHDTMVREEMERHMPTGYRDTRVPGYRRPFGTTIRAWIGDGLIAVGAWIAPSAQTRSSVAEGTRR